MTSPFLASRIALKTRCRASSIQLHGFRGFSASNEKDNLSAVRSHSSMSLNLHVIQALPLVSCMWQEEKQHGTSLPRQEALGGNQGLRPT
ncbi:hypothetical protein AGIG_G9454 [Arapaima gigas]